MKIEQFGPLNIVYMKRTDAYGIENKILMEEFKHWVAAENLLNKAAIILGIAQDNPSLIAPEECRYDICLNISDDTKIKTDNNVQIGVVQGGKYVIFQM